MLKSIQKYFKNRTEAAEKTAFENGFGWAMTEVFLNGRDKEKIAAMVDKYYHNDFTQFDEGGREALSRMDSFTTKAEYMDKVEQENTSLRNEINWYTEQLTASNGRISELNAANKGLRVTLTNLLAAIPDAWEPGDKTVRTSQLPKDLEGIELNSEWPELWVAQDENGAWNEYNGDIEPSEEKFIIQQCVVHSQTTKFNYLTRTNKNPNWKETKQRIR